MSTLFGRLGLRNRRNKLITGTVFSAAAAALVAGAVIYPGFKTTEVDLNDPANDPYSMDFDPDRRRR